jgi:hypothetical protein
MPRETPARRLPAARRAALFFSLGVVIAFYAWAVAPGGRFFSGFGGASDYYNLLVRGFRSGHLSLQADVPPGLLRLKDPYDPAQNAPFGMHDVSFYKGKFYLYFGVAPAVALYWPFAALSGHFLDDRHAIFLFCSVGFLASSFLLVGIRRRYFPDSGVAGEAAAILAVGLANMVPMLLRRPQVYEVAVSSAYAFYALSLVGVHRSLHGKRTLGWLAFASLCLGLAVASRPTYFLAPAALLIPVCAGLGSAAPAVRGDGAGWLARACAAFIPAGLVVAAVLAYNDLRFDSPLEFGAKWMFSGFNATKTTQFSLSYLWYDVRTYLFAPAHLSAYFPFVRVVSLAPPPAGHSGGEDPYGVFPNMPFVALAAASALACVNRPKLKPFALFVAVSSAEVACVIFMYQFTTNRYMVDFLPGFMLLAVIGFWGLQEHFSGAARGLATAGCWVLLAWSVLFNLFASLGHNELLRANNPVVFRRLLHAFDYPRYRFDRFSGRTYGPVELTVKFPTDRTGKVAPLLITGSEFLSDYLYVYYAAADKVAIGFEHAGYGGTVSEAVPVDYSRPHHIEVDMPPLYPPAGDPYFDGIPPGTLEAFNLRLRVSIDGNRVIDTAERFHPPFAFRPTLGSDVSPQGPLGGRFSGEMLGIRRLSADWTAMTKAERVGPLVIFLEFPTGHPGAHEPLVSTGDTGRGDVLAVNYVDSNHATFSLDHWGYGGPTSDPVEIKPGVRQTLRVSFGSFFPASARPGEVPVPQWSHAAEKLEVVLDNHPVLEVRTPFYDAAPETVAVGRNQIGSSTCASTFSGRIIGYFRGSPNGAGGGPP